MSQNPRFMLRKSGFPWLSDQALYIALGLSLSCLYLFALNALGLVFLAGLILTILISALVFIRSNENVLGYACALAIAFLLSGSKSIGWDAASFELPSYYDWIHGLRGAYWDYSKLPSFFYGLSYTLGRDAYRLVYTLQAILMVIGLSRITEERRSPVYFAIVTYLLLHLFPQLFDHGKGDLFALDFSLIALAFAPLNYKNNPQAQASQWVIFLLFGSLAIASKLSAVLAILPLGLAALFQGHFTEIWRRNKTLMTLALTLTCTNFSVNVYNLVHYGAILDPENAASGSAFSLIHQLPKLASEALSFPPNLYAAVILLTGLIAVDAILSKGVKTEYKTRNGVLLFTLLMTPLVLLFEFKQSTNLRLIAFPVLAILGMNSWRIRGNPAA
jgi:hypothetical protein